MTSLKLALASLAAAATTVVACAAPTETPDVDIDADETSVACMKGSILCGGVAPPPTGGSSGVFAPPTPVRGPQIPCYGDGPEGNGAIYVVTKPRGTNDDLRCWSGRYPEVKPGEIPSGFDLLSLYYCPAAYPVNRCDWRGYCYCWTY